MRTTAILLTLLTSTGCASAFMRGATTVGEPPASPVAVYTVSACNDMANQQPIEMPGLLKYYLVDGPKGPVLYEFDAKGNNGMKVTNHWQQEDGSDVFFMWVGTSHGYQFVLTKDRSQGGVRLVYLRGTFKSYADNGISKVRGTAGVLCPMTAT